ncbi:integrase-like protein [Tumebacillus sp. BK434]|uniref:tyrosine-type recombinase/integrase n=1 Tax=Tumebacillus sp. BK434 TaxID=2512169 RepID=UPI0010F408FA|nr:phage integrase SAM-like domain-containing protein [Tumebacillus sp. BK434]TCP53387.1 integrase-like protein [Tumebacillus sp. BK434]
MEKRKRKTVRTHRALSVAEQEVLQEEGVSLEQAMDQFLQAKQAERAAQRTIRDYKTHFRYLLSWLKKNHPLATLPTITVNMLREYVNWMTSGKELYDDHPQKRKKKGIVGLSPMTVNVRIRTMRAFFNWCEREGLVQQSPAFEIKLQKVDEDKICSFTEEQLRKLLSVPDRNIFNEFRDYVIMATLADTGLRISELLSLKAVDVDFEQLTLTVPWEKEKLVKHVSYRFQKKLVAC